MYMMVLDFERFNLYFLAALFSNLNAYTFPIRELAMLYMKLYKFEYNCDSLQHVINNISTATAAANEPCKWSEQ